MPWKIYLIFAKKNYMKFLIACLGNIGAEYDETRHNVGFKVADKLAKDLDATFTLGRLAMTAEMRFKGRILRVIKPTTFMNLSGKAVKYWASQEDIPMENIIVVCDDIAIPVGTIRLKTKGSDGGHNGLANIIENLGTVDFSRIRVGIGNDFPKGRQIDYVLGKWKPSEIDMIEQKTDIAVEMIKSFVTQGAQMTMSQYNNK